MRYPSTPCAPPSRVTSERHAPDPAFRWLDPVITGTTVSLAGTNTMTVANELVHDSGGDRLQKDVTGSIEGYIGGTGENFTLHGVCTVPGEDDIDPRRRSGTIANGGEVVVEPVSIGWTCFGVESAEPGPAQPARPVRLGRPDLHPFSAVRSHAGGSRARLPCRESDRAGEGHLKIVKVVDDPFQRGFRRDDSSLADGRVGTGGDRSITGTWSITPPETTYEPPDQILLESECTATENPPDPSELPDDSYAWGTTEIDGPATVVPGGTATVTVTNTVERVFGALEITKTVVDPDGGVLPGAAFPGVWECTAARTRTPVARG